MDPKISIIILNWNGWEDTIECLESLYQINYPNYDVIIVDNGSEDESTKKIKQYCEGKIKVKSQFFEYNLENKPIKIIEYTREEAEAGGGKEKEIENLPSNRELILIKSERNYGFAEGNNIAIRYALKALNPDYVLLLNNDTVVDLEFLSELVKVGERDERIGILGPKMYYYNYNGKSDVFCSAGGKINKWRIPQVYFTIGQKEVDIGQYDCIKEVDWISGAAMMVKSIAMKKLSLLNSNYFFGNEDVEYCMKARKQDAKVIYVPEAKIWHKKEMSRSKTGYNIFNYLPSYLMFVKENFSKFVFLYNILLIPALLLAGRLLDLKRTFQAKAKKQENF
jgi:GT2 family glycosyltransferase